MRKMQTEWSPAGNRLTVEELESGTIFLTFESLVVIKGESGASHRNRWLRSQISVPSATPLSEGAALVQMWLDFYADSELLESGVVMYHELVNTIPIQEEELPISTPQRGLN